MEIKNRKVFLRTDFNVPIKNNIVADSYRIDCSIETLRDLKKGDNKTLIVSHIETKGVEKPSLKPVFDYIKSNYQDIEIFFSDKIEDFENVNSGQFMLLENIRNFSEEKENDVSLAKKIKNITDFYINDAFAVSHRNHMSVSVLPKLYNLEDKMFGLQMKKEINELSKILKPEKPFAVILSGAKFSTKLPLIEKYLSTADDMFIGGALYNNILKSMGFNIGKSLIDNDAVYIDKMVKDKSFIDKVFIPKKVIIKDDEDNIIIKKIDEIIDNDNIQDIDIESIDNFVKKISLNNVKTIVWNGPLGNYEIDEFKKGTMYLANKLVDLVYNNKNLNLFIGGGDTVAALKDLNINNERIFISTGGGAMLEFLEKDGVLPGVISVLN